MELTGITVSHIHAKIGDDVSIRISRGADIHGYSELSVEMPGYSEARQVAPGTEIARAQAIAITMRAKQGERVT